MRFQCSGSYTEGVADVDPVAAPETALPGHILMPNPNVLIDPSALFLMLAGVSTESVTLTLYLLLENLGIEALSSDYINVNARWLQFATGIVVTNGTLTKVTAGLPAGGIIYGRMTAETITAAQTRKLLTAWVRND